jgi:hypothetical protein
MPCRAACVIGPYLLELGKQLLALRSIKPLFQIRHELGHLARAVEGTLDLSGGSVRGNDRIARERRR